MSDEEPFDHLDASIVILRGLGYEHKEIAEQLGVNPNTVSERRKAIYEYAKKHHGRTAVILRIIFMAQPSLFVHFGTIKDAMVFMRVVSDE